MTQSGAKVELYMTSKNICISQYNTHYIVNMWHQ